MKASENKVEDFLSTNKTQFIIPVYQRNYDWSSDQCKQLLDDILEVGSNDQFAAHFIGSIVYIHDAIYTSSSIKELTIIDGQQRLTTLTLIYLALLDLAKEIKNESLANEISETYLINKFAPKGEKLKLRPTENNDKALKYILRGDESEDFPSFSRLIHNFNNIRNKITEDNYEFILSGLSRLIFVEISLDREKDDPQRIFESLNSTGLELSQADLIRNYILMGLKRDDQNRIYQDYWEVIENLARNEINNESYVSDYIRDYLTLENKKIPNRGKVYIEFKAKCPPKPMDSLEENLGRMKRLVGHYNKLTNPRNETDKDIRLQLEYINRIEINVAFPFLLQVYDDYISSIISKNIFLEVLDLIQSYAWRRFIVGLPTNALNKIFMSLYDKVEVDNYLYSVQKSLLQKSGSQLFPNNKEVIDALKVKDVYNIKSKNRIYLLERLENYANAERVTVDGNQDITVEHIFPQNPDARWRIDLGNDEYSFVKANYLHTIGNLTLSGNNGSLGNKSFIDKRDLENVGYKDSRLWMNKYLANLEKWDQDAIESRFAMIAERFLKIWKYPEIEVDTNELNGEVNIFEADDPTHKKLEYAIFFDQKIKINQVSQLYVAVFKQLFDLQPDTFFATDLGERVGLRKQPRHRELRKAAPINDTYFIECHMDNATKFSKIKQALTVFGIEDELSIKYA